jgi:hypothetical protein
MEQRRLRTTTEVRSPASSTTKIDEPLANLVRCRRWRRVPTGCRTFVRTAGIQLLRQFPEVGKLSTPSDPLPPTGAAKSGIIGGDNMLFAASCEQTKSTVRQHFGDHPKHVDVVVVILTSRFRLNVVGSRPWVGGHLAGAVDHQLAWLEGPPGHDGTLTCGEKLTAP